MRALRKHSNKSVAKKDSLTTNEDEILLESAKIASSKAIRSSTALGISFKIIRGDEIILINPDKSEQVLRKIPKSTIDTSALKKGMILERNKLKWLKQD